MDGLLHTADKMVADGAILLDIGGASTRPGAPEISTEEEMDRVLPIISAIYKHFPDIWLSVDTYNAAVAKAAVAEGASIINDVSSGRFDTGMVQTVAALQVPYIAMHMQGSPQTMQLDPQYGNVVTEVRDYLRDVCFDCAQAGIKDIIIDPGFGFGKTNEHNFSLLSQLSTFRILGKPILAGLSRKSMICKTLHVNPDHALNGTTALHTVALQQGASILRAHDVREAVEVIKLFEQL